MLQALTPDGKIVILAHLTASEIELHRRKTRFYCPACKEPVMIKSGPQVIPHFAHYPRSDCPKSSQGESILHKKGKLLLYKWLRKQKIKVSLERYIPQIKQQPDLLLEIYGRRIAIEYQCSRTKIHEIVQRNKGYLSLDIQPIWILGGNFLHRLKENQVKVNAYIAQFIHRFQASKTDKLFFFCPQTNQLTIFQDIVMYTKTKAIGNLTVYPLFKTSFKQLFKDLPLNDKYLYQMWKSFKKEFRMMIPYPIHGQEKRWHFWLYKQRTHVQYLPSIIYLPTRNQFMMKSPPWIWQSHLCFHIIKNRQINDSFTFQQCLASIQKHLPHVQNFPLIFSFKHPVKQYLHLLIQQKFIRKTSSQFYKVQKRLTFQQHIEKSIKEDQKLMNRFIKKLN